MGSQQVKNSAHYLLIAVLVAIVVTTSVVLVTWTGRQGELTSSTVQLSYYNPQRDLDQSGNIQCSSAGLVSVPRTVTSTKDIIADTIRLLLQGQLTQAERASGTTTEFPLSGVTLDKAELADGILGLTFSDPLNRTGGGSCRVGILWAQIKPRPNSSPAWSKLNFSQRNCFSHNIDS